MRTASGWAEKRVGAGSDSSSARSARVLEEASILLLSGKSGQANLPDRTIDFTGGVAMEIYDYPPIYTNQPDMAKIMSTLYELWFRERGADVKVTFASKADTSVQGTPAKGNAEN